MSLRRPSLRSTLYMILLAAGILLAGHLIFRGAGAPREPARIVVPADRAVRLDSPGLYIVFIEQVAAPRAAAQAELRDPDITLELTDPSGARVELPPAGIRGWFFKFLTRQRGHTLGLFRAAGPGDYRVKADLA